MDDLQPFDAKQFADGLDPDDEVLARAVEFFRVYEGTLTAAGAIDFAAALRAIRDIGYSGWITIELYPYVENPDEAAARALRHITEVQRSL